MQVSMTALERVKSVVVGTLGIEDRAHELDAETELLGSLPELDSLAVLELAGGLEEEFGFDIDDEDFSGETFETLGSLTRFVEQRIA